MNASYQTTISADKIEYAELTDLMEKLSKGMRTKAVIERQFLIGTDDAEMSGIFDTLADRLTRNGSKVNPEGPTPRKEKTVTGQIMGARSYRMEATGEILSASVLNKRLANYEIAPNTVLINAKGKRFSVRPVEVGEPMALIEE
jgi:hypothetical protein